MKHLAKIQSEFLKYASDEDWNTLSYEAQLEYLKEHPKSKRRLTAKPGQKGKPLSELKEKLEGKKEEMSVEDIDSKVMSYIDSLSDEYKELAKKIFTGENKDNLLDNIKASLETYIKDGKLDEDTMNEQYMFEDGLAADLVITVEELEDDDLKDKVDDFLYSSNQETEDISGKILDCFFNEAKKQLKV